MSLTRLAKRVVLANRVKKQFKHRSNPPITQASDRILTPLSIALTERIPLELYEHIIDHLCEDIPTLLACSLVCKAWVSACRYHLFGRRLIIRPLQLTGSITRVNCAVALRRKQFILYGTDDGIYVSNMGSGTPIMPLLLIPSVIQIDILERYDIIVFLSEQHIFTVPLRGLSHADPKTSSACTRISSHATFFKLGLIMGRLLLCVVKAGMTTTTCKLFEPKLSQGFSLQLYREFYISEKVLSMDFLRTKVVAGTSRHDFEIVDVQTLDAQPLLDPSAVLPKVKPNRCLAVLRIDDEVILCYSAFAIYVDTQGRLLEKLPIRWRSNDISTVVLREPYMLAFGSEHIEVYLVYTGALVQTVWVATAVLSASSEFPIIQAQDGRILGLTFSD